MSHYDEPKKSEQVFCPIPVGEKENRGYRKTAKN
jgi:hypothetical protein